MKAKNLKKKVIKMKKVDVKFCKAMARSLGILKEWWDNWVLESESLNKFVKFGSS